MILNEKRMGIIIYVVATLMVSYQTFIIKWEVWGGLDVTFLIIFIVGSINYIREYIKSKKMKQKKGTETD